MFNIPPNIKLQQDPATPEWHPELTTEFQIKGDFALVPKSFLVDIKKDLQRIKTSISLTECQAIAEAVNSRLSLKANRKQNPVQQQQMEAVAKDLSMQKLVSDLRTDPRYNR
jgi:hypothetical protein